MGRATIRWALSLLAVVLVPVAVVAQLYNPGFVPFSRPGTVTIGNGSPIVFQYDYTTGSLPSSVSDTRAAPPASYTNASGILSFANANVPRFDYSPSLVARGLLTEDTKTNVAFPSNNFSGWDMPGATVTKLAAGTAPDGSSSAFRVAIASSGFSAVRAAFSFPSATAGAQTVYAKASTSGGAANLRVTSNNGAAWNTGISTKVALTTQWQRVANTGTLQTGGSSAYFVIGNVDVAGNGDATCAGNVDIAFAQMEAGSPTSYIATTTTAVTRAADVLSLSLPGPSVAEVESLATGAVSRAAYPAGGFALPANVRLRSMAVWPVGTPPSYLNTKLVPGTPYQ